MFQALFSMRAAKCRAWLAVLREDLWFVHSKEVKEEHLRDILQADASVRPDITPDSPLVKLQNIFKAV